MKYQLFILFCCSLFNFSISYCQAPDFTVTDIQGNQHSLYEDYLNKGKTVIIDFSATWCSPCWVAHQSHVLKDVYEILGPDGLDQLMILFIEPDPNTSLEDLYGPSENSIGDWVTGTPYPIINTATDDIADDFEVLYFPTIQLICPDGSIGEQDLWVSSINVNGDFNSEYVLNEVMECIGVSSLDKDLRLLGASTNNDQMNCSSAHSKAWIHNNGQEPITTFELVIKKNEEQLNMITWEGNLLSGQIDSIDLGYLDLPEGEEIYEYDIEIVTDDNNNANNTSSITLHSRPSLNNEITVEIQADNYTTGDETGYTISTIEGEVLFDSGILTPDELHVASYTLEEEGCYLFEITDEYGDGNSGSIIIKDSNGVTALDAPNFGGSYFSLPFNAGNMVSSTKIPTTIPLKCTLYPNPTTVDYTELYIQSSTSDFLDIAILNSSGQCIKVFRGHTPSDAYKFRIDLSEKPSGIYWVKIQNSGGEILTTSVIKQ